MTLRSRIFGLFPALWLVSVCGCTLAVCISPGAFPVLGLLVTVYLVPVACYRLHNAVWPLLEGRSPLDKPAYAPWWGGHQFQVVYNAFPALEAALRLVPGLYSAWLRLWGSRIGHSVYWTPVVDISDRALLDIGDGAILGHRVACYSHLIQRRASGLVLYVRRVRIGAGAMIGAGSRLGPGTRVDAGVEVPVLTAAVVGRRLRKPMQACSAH
jgi:hypothetical protein